MKPEFKNSYNDIEKSIINIRLFYDISIKEINSIYNQIHEFMDVLPLEINSELPLGVQITKNVNIVIGNMEKSSNDDKKIGELYYNHSTRVIETGMAIYNIMSDKEKENISIDNFVCSAILHDIGKIFKIDNHGVYSYVIASYMLKKMKFDECRTEEILYSILVHSFKDMEGIEPFISIQDKLLMDADLMDDIKCKYKIIKIKKKQVSIEVGDKKKIMFNDVAVCLGEIRQKIIDKKSSKIKTESGKLFFNNVMDEYIQMMNLYAPTSSNTVDLSMGLLK